MTKETGKFTENDFAKIIRLSAQPVQAPSQRGKPKRSGGYSDKQTRPHKSANTSGKRRDKSRQ